MITNVNLKEKYNLECFKHLLEKYRDYKSIYREIKINSILGKKCQFDITDIYPPLLCNLGTDNHSSNVLITTDLKSVAFKINEITLIINSDLEVENIMVDIEILETLNGKILESLIELAVINPVVMQSIDEYFIVGFYASYPKCDIAA